MALAFWVPPTTTQHKHWLGGVHHQGGGVTGEIVPISDEQAKALQEGFKFAGQSLDMVKAVGGYLAAVLGSGPEDLVGLLGGDWLRVRRAVNLANMIEK